MKYLDKISMVTVSSLLIFLGGLAISVELIREKLNEQARVESVDSINRRIDMLAGHVSLIARDYNNWSDVYQATQDGNIGFIADNYGITAINGDIFDSAEMFDGHFRQPISWISGSSRNPSPTFFTESDLQGIRQATSSLTWGNRSTFDFIMLVDNNLSFFSASDLLPDTPDDFKKIEPTDVSIAVIGRRLRQPEIDAIKTDFLVSDFSITSNPKIGQSSAPLIGIGGRAVAYFNWAPPKAGNRLLFLIFPILVGVAGTFIGATLFGAKILRSYMRNLIERESDAAHAARTDNLSQLPNRFACMEYVERMQTRRALGFAVIVFDLNGFKRVNDFAGHMVGDDVIRSLARRIERLTGPNTFLARLGGDEFVAILVGETDSAVLAESFVDGIFDCLHTPFSCGSGRFQISAAVGVALGSGDILEGNELLRRADRAMYCAKLGLGNQVRLYSREMDQVRDHEKNVEAALRIGLDHPGEFHIFYQPIVDAQTGALRSVEALARWNSSILGVVGPEHFIAVAEKTGLIVPLGNILLEHIFSDLSLVPDLLVCVNISPVQLISADFVSDIERISKLYGVEPMRIEIELTEGFFVSNSYLAGKRLSALRALGFRTSLDDFGTGFSSIGYLRTLPFDTLKMDRSLISNDDSAWDRAKVLGSIIALGHSLNLMVVAEGVETSLEANLLRRAGCDFLQGYLFGKPQPLADLVNSGGLQIGIVRTAEFVRAVLR